MSSTISNGYVGYVDPDFPNPGTDADSSIIIYGYTPSFALALLSIILFALGFSLHFAQLLRYRTLYFGIPICIGAAFEIVGYVMRALSAKVSPYRVSYFVTQYFFIVVAPVFFSASIYAVLSALIRRHGSQYSPVLGPRAVLAVFITADVVSTVVQIVGAALIGVSESNRRDPTTANNILLAGLAIQCASFLLFLVFLTLFFVRIRRVAKGTDGISSQASGRRTTLLAAAFVAASLLIYLRTCFRLSETSEGLFSTLQTREVYFGCLEFMPVILAVLVLAIAHPHYWANS